MTKDICFECSLEVPMRFRSAGRVIDGIRMRLGAEEICLVVRLANTPSRLLLSTTPVTFQIQTPSQLSLMTEKSTATLLLEILQLDFGRRTLSQASEGIDVVEYFHCAFISVWKRPTIDGRIRHPGAAYWNGVGG